MLREMRYRDDMRALVALLAGTCVVGCSLFTSLDDLRAGGGADGSANESGADAGDTNFVADPSFEQGAGGCGANWGDGYNDSIARTSPGRTGNSACLVCLQSGATGSYQINAVATIPVQTGQYYAEAWLSTPDGGVATQAGIQVYFTGDGGINGCNGDGTSYCQGSQVTPPIGSWSGSNTTFVVTGSGTVSIDLHSYADATGSCFIVDDVALYLQ